MRLHEISKTHPRPQSRRVGRGIAAGGGKTAGRGNKGQKARTGANSNVPRTFVGAGTSFIQQLPKLKGFTSARTKPVTLNVAILAKQYEANETVTLVSLLEKGIISVKEAEQGVKIVGSTTSPKHSLEFEQDNSKLTVSRTLLASKKE